MADDSKVRLAEIFNQTDQKLQFEAARHSSNTGNSGPWNPFHFDKNEIHERLAKALGSIATVGPSAATQIGSTTASSDVDEDQDMKCDRCGSTKDLKLCGVCKQVRYCSVECQRKAWVTHKAVCKKR